MRINKKILFFVLISILASPLYAYAGACGSTSSGSSVLDTALKNVGTAAMAIGSAIAIIGFVIAGILWLMSGGAPEKMKTAKSALIAAVIGTALIAISQAGNIMQDVVCKLIGQ